MEYDYPRMGVFFISDELSNSLHRSVEEKMNELLEKVDKEFETWLNENGLECAMGVVKYAK